MIISILGLSMIACIMYEVWWLIPFLILGVEVATGFSGSIVGVFSTFGGDDDV